MEELRRIRGKRGWSQYELARQSGVNAATINQIEMGRRSPRVETLEKLAVSLEVDIADLFPKAQASLPFETAGGKRREEVLRGLSKSITGMASSAKSRLDNIAGSNAVSGAVSRMTDGEFRLIVGWLLGAHDMVGHMLDLLRETLPSEHEQDSADERELRIAYSLLRQEFDKAVTDDLIERVESDIDNAEEAGMLHDIKERTSA